MYVTSFNIIWCNENTFQNKKKTFNLKNISWESNKHKTYIYYISIDCYTFLGYYIYAQFLIKSSKI